MNGANYSITIQIIKTGQKFSERLNYKIDGNLKFHKKLTTRIFLIVTKFEINTVMRINSTTVSSYVHHLRSQFLKRFLIKQNAFTQENKRR